MTHVIKIGISACIMHPDPNRIAFNGRTLLYLEESLGHYAMSKGAVAFLLPTLSPSRNASTVSQMISCLDGIILHGGADVCPKNYGEELLDPKWPGDPIRDAYELAIVQEAVKQNKPILGICRGHQLLNVAFGGTLYQDIETQVPHSSKHRDAEIYDKNYHKMRIIENSKLSQLFPQVQQATINSVHHQAVKSLGKNLIPQCYSHDDQIIESIYLHQHSELDPYCLGVQWHPEFQTHEDQNLLDPTPILDDFLEAIKIRQI